jgi:hypothetical protein
MGETSVPQFFERTAFLGAIGVGFVLSVAWTAALGYGLFRVAAFAF